MTRATQLWATVSDLYDSGPPRAALAGVSLRRRERALRAASGTLASLIRGPYQLPLQVGLEETGDEELGAGGAVLIDAPGPLVEAVAYAVRIETGGTVGADPITVVWGTDFDLEGAPEDWELEHSATLGMGGELTLGGVRFQFSGTLEPGGVAWARAGVVDEVARAVVHLAAYDLLFTRGIDPGTEDGQRLKERFDTAIAWGDKIQKRDAKLDEAQDATTAIEPRARYGTRSTSSSYLGPFPYGRRESC